MNIQIIPEQDRPGFPTEEFKSPVFDLAIFHMADTLFPDYHGGYWHYCYTDEGVPFFMLRRDGLQEVSNPFSGETVIVDSILAGMIITSYALLNEVERHYRHDLVTKLDNLNHAIVTYCKEINRMDVWMTIMD